MNLIDKKIFFLSLIFLISNLCLVPIAEALELKLLWEKQFKDDIRDIRMAKNAGDIILSTSEEIFLYDKNGNTVFHWGPRVDRDAGSVDISSNGSIVVYKTSWKESFQENKGLEGWDERIHYTTRKGKEVWNKNWPGYARLSSDASKIILNYGGGEGQGFDVLDSKGNTLWTKTHDSWGGITTKFSPDGNYIALVGDLEAPLLLIKANDGTVLWTSTDYVPGAASISTNAGYITTFPNYGGPDHPERTHNGKVYDRNGNVVLEGYGILSDNGTRIVMLYPNKISILDLPSKTVIKEFLITTSSEALTPFFPSVALSYDGNYAAIIGKMSDSSNNLFAIDVTTGQIWATNVGLIAPDSPTDRDVLFMTSDGKYCFVVSLKGKNIRMYQLY